LSSWAECVDIWPFQLECNIDNTPIENVGDVSQSLHVPQPSCAEYAAGEAEAIYRRADATAKGISLVSQAVTAHGGSEAASLRVAEQYLTAFGQIAKAGNTLLLPAATNDPANMVAQALSIYKTVAANHPSTGPRSPFCHNPQ